MIDLEMKEIISRHKTDMTEKIARLSQAEERLIICMSKLEQKKRENEELSFNLQNALDRKQTTLLVVCVCSINLCCRSFISAG